LITETGEFFTVTYDTSYGEYNLNVGTMTIVGTVGSPDGEQLSGGQETSVLYFNACDNPYLILCGPATSQSVGGTIASNGLLTLDGDQYSTDPQYNKPSGFAVIAGNYFGSLYGGYAPDTYNVTTGGGNLSISSTGALTELDADDACGATGQIKIIDPRFNAYDIVNLTYNGDPSCDPNLIGATGHGVVVTYPGGSNPSNDQMLLIVVVWTDMSGNILGNSDFTETVTQ
jgi:hypothetical protein